ncbi:hypothetical protein CVU75_00720 [Candidatus Dependentiae bacterium HGW-Dependentiae-1]|nr:MAG: hypothetical protein CVU75_00720 [Candidatus Dependentiae bacterium HGW-Dependentiae-1]
MKAKEPGEFFQIDHMSINISSGFQVKHFQGICPVTKIVFEQAFSSATNFVARQFLKYPLSNLPFPIKSVQVKGGVNL